MISLTALFLFSSQSFHASDFRKWGLETVTQMKSDLYIPTKGTYGEEARSGEKPADVVFTWGLGVLLQSLNAAAATDLAFRPELESTLRGASKYWNSQGPVAGYDVHPGPKPVDRYYDDNEWMVLALVESSKVLGSRSLLKQAERTFKFVISGRDDVLGGGIYWRETDKASKNTCSNAPAAAAALALYEATGKKTYLTNARELYVWTKSHLQDPADGLYWDNISAAGKVDRTKWSYNTGLMLRSATDLFRFTKEESFAADVREMQSASLKRWVSNYATLKDDGKFIHLLVENWLRAFRTVPGTADPRSAIERGLLWLHNQSRDSLGHYGNRWGMMAETAFSPFKLIDQAAAARAFLVMAADSSSASSTGEPHSK